MKLLRTDSENYWAGVLCLTGFFLHILLSDPLLNALGVHYSGDEGKFYEKIHPGTILIFLSLLVLLAKGSNPIERFFAIAREHAAFVVLLALYVLLFLYMAARSGFAGLAFIIDTHMSAAICAIVLSYAPPSLCRKAVNFFIGASLVNGLIGIAEAIGKFRIFTFDPDWPVMHEQYFRASAFIGHPLDNAIFTSVALCVLLALDYSRWIKNVATIIFMAALVAFGGRASIVFSVGVLAVLARANAWRVAGIGEITAAQAFTAAGVIVSIALFCAVLFVLLTHSMIGERVAASINWDESARSRLLAFRAFSYMNDEELWFGVPAGRIIAITARMNLVMPLTEIENPWIMMCMNLGFITFPFWLAATIWFICHLGKNKPLALQMAIAAYFMIATLSNTFGRKDANYAIMVCAVVCAGRLLNSSNFLPGLPVRR